MKREELLSSPEYWTVKIQSQLLQEISSELTKTGKSQKEYAQDLGVSKSYISQILNGDFDHRISKMVELALAIGKVPKIEFVNLNEVLLMDKLEAQFQVFNNPDLIDDIINNAQNQSAIYEHVYTNKQVTYEREPEEYQEIRA